MFAFLHGHEDPQEVVGTRIHQMIPAFQLPTPGKDLAKVIFELLYFRKNLIAD